MDEMSYMLLFILEERHNHNTQQYDVSYLTLFILATYPACFQSWPNRVAALSGSQAAHETRLSRLRTSDWRDLPLLPSFSVVLMAAHCDGCRTRQQLSDGYIARHLRDSLRLMRQPAIIHERCVERWQSIGESLCEDVPTWQTTCKSKRTVAAVARYVQ